MMKSFVALCPKCGAGYVSGAAPKNGRCSCSDGPRLLTGLRLCVHELEARLHREREDHARERRALAAAALTALVDHKCFQFARCIAALGINRWDAAQRIEELIPAEEAREILKSWGKKESTS